MRDAFGALQWKRGKFWRSTLTDYITAIGAFNEMHGGGKARSSHQGRDGRTAGEVWLRFYLLFIDDAANATAKAKYQIEKSLYVIYS